MAKMMTSKSCSMEKHLSDSVLQLPVFLLGLPEVNELGPDLYEKLAPLSGTHPELMPSWRKNYPDN